MFLHKHIAIENKLLLQILNVFRVISCSFVYAKSVTHKLNLKRSKWGVENLARKCWCSHESILVIVFKHRPRIWLRWVYDLVNLTHDFVNRRVVGFVATWIPASLSFVEEVPDAFQFVICQRKCVHLSSVIQMCQVCQTILQLHHSIFYNLQNQCRSCTENKKNSWCDFQGLRDDARLSYSLSEVKNRSVNIESVAFFCWECHLRLKRIVFFVVNIENGYRLLELRFVKGQELDQKIFVSHDQLPLRNSWSASRYSASVSNRRPWITRGNCLLVLGLAFSVLVLII